MRGTHYITYLYLKVHVVLQTRLARVAISRSTLMLVAAAVAFVLHLVGHAHATTLAVQQFTDNSPDGEWPGG